MEEIHVIKYTPLIRPRQPRRGAVHELQPVLLLIAAKLVVIHDTPRESGDDIDAILIDRLEHFGEEVGKVGRALEVEALRVLRAGELHERVEAEFGDGDPRGAEGVPEVAQVLAEILGGQVGVGVAFVAVDPAVCLDVGEDRALGIQRIGDVGRAGFNAVRRCGGKLSRVRVDAEEVDGVGYVRKVAGGQRGEIDACGGEHRIGVIFPEEKRIRLDADDEVLISEGCRDIC